MARQTQDKRKDGKARARRRQKKRARPDLRREPAHSLRDGLVEDHLHLAEVAGPRPDPQLLPGQEGRAAPGHLHASVHLRAAAGRRSGQQQQQQQREEPAHSGHLGTTAGGRQVLLARLLGRLPVRQWEESTRR